MEFGRPLAVVAGANAGIGLELAKCCAKSGFDLVIAADDPQIEDSARALREHGTSVQAVFVHLAVPDGVARLYRALSSRPVDALLINTQLLVGREFLDQPFSEVQQTIYASITGSAELLHRIGRDMRQREAGRILLTGSIDTGAEGGHRDFRTVDNGIRAFMEVFSRGLASELATSGVTLTRLLPGAARALANYREDPAVTKCRAVPIIDAAKLARIGFDAMMAKDSERAMS